MDTKDATEDPLLSRIRARIAQASPDDVPPRPAAPLNATDLGTVRRTLDMALPPDLVTLWQQIGNGGFGPGYGLLGVGPEGFPDDVGFTADRRYLGWRQAGWNWPRGLLPLCHFGCGIYHCIDVEQDRILIWEPNVWDGEAPVETCLFVPGLTLRAWLDRWTHGEDMFLLLAPPDYMEIALPRLVPPH